MWADAQRDGRPAEYRWRPVFNAAVWLTPTTTVPCSNGVFTRGDRSLRSVARPIGRSQLHTPGTHYRLTLDLVTLYTPLKTPQNTPVQTVLT